MAYLATVQDYVNRARVLVQDQVQPYRYDDARFMEALTEGFAEIFRIRPDILPTYFKQPLPSFEALGTTVSLDQRYRMALVYFIAGSVHLIDEEPSQDARATGFLNAFKLKLLSTAS